jgi:Protein NO VEIN, C-terminal
MLALWLRDADLRYAPLCLDLICWENNHLNRLRAACDARGLDLEAAELVTIVPRDNQMFGAVSAVRIWGPFRTPLGLLTAERLSQDAAAELIDPDLGSRVKRFATLRQDMSAFDDGRPTPDEVADWCEKVAAKLHDRHSEPTVDHWISLYEDLAVVLPDDDAQALSGRRLILDDKNKLQPCRGEHESAGPTIFFWPVQDRTEGEEDVEASLNVSPPRALARDISFTHRSLTWYVQDGPRRTARRCRRFLEAAGLVRRYRTQDVLEAVGRVLKSRRSEAVLREALFFVFRLRDRTSGKQALDELGLHVPTGRGWSPASQALFSASWPKTQGASLTRLIQLTGSISPAMKALEDSFLRPPQEWLRDASLDEWTMFLRRIGVQDGLWPVTLGTKAFREYGADFTPRAWGRAVGLDDESMAMWQSEVPRANGFYEHPQTIYTSVGNLWYLPGQFEHRQFPASAQLLFANLVVENLSRWSEDYMTVGIRRASYPGELPMIWPTPLTAFLRRAAWVPVKTPEEAEPVLHSAAKAWFFDDNQADAPPPFAPLIPRTTRRLLEGNHKARQLLRSCGVRCWNDPQDAADLLHLLFELRCDDRVPPTQLALFRRQYEQAVERILGQGNNPWTDRDDVDLVVQSGRRVEALCANAASGTIYIDDGSDPVTREIITDLAAPIVCARAADGARLAPLLSGVLGDQVRLLSEVDVEIAVDGVPVSDETAGTPLINPGSEWLVELVVAALEFRSSEFRRQTERTLRDAARRLRELRVIPAADLTISVDGQPALDPRILHGALAVVNETQPMIIIQEFPGEFTWPTLERISTALAQVVRAPEIGPVIFEAFVRIGRTQEAGIPLQPSEEELANALGISLTQLQEARQLLQSSLETLADRLHIALACFASAAAATKALSPLLQVTSEGGLIAILRGLDIMKWRSGYRDKVLGGAEGDDTLGYDIEVITQASTFLFEVKSSIDDGTDFELSDAEVNAARLHVGRDAYRIIYVRYVLDPARTTILLLPNPFTKRGQETYRFIGSGLHYRFSTI